MRRRTAGHNHALVDSDGGPEPDHVTSSARRAGSEGVREHDTDTQSEHNLADRGAGIACTRVAEIT